MKTTTALSLVLAGAAFVLLRPATACPNLAEVDRPATTTASAAAPAYPIAGFEQMLAAREPSAPTTASTAHRDVLLPYVQAMLWHAPGTERREPATRVAHMGVAR